MKYKVGDKLVTRNDLEAYEWYGDNSFNKQMTCGGIIEVIGFEYGHYLSIENGLSWYYTDEMIDHERTKMLHIKEELGDILKKGNKVYIKDSLHKEFDESHRFYVVYLRAGQHTIDELDDFDGYYDINSKADGCWYSLDMIDIEKTKALYEDKVKITSNMDFDNLINGLGDKVEKLQNDIVKLKSIACGQKDSITMLTAFVKGQEKRIDDLEEVYEDLAHELKQLKESKEVVPLDIGSHTLTIDKEGITIYTKKQDDKEEAKEYKIGDRVFIKEGLVANKLYNDIRFDNKMTKGDWVTIESLFEYDEYYEYDDFAFHVEEDKYLYSIDMIDHERTAQGQVGVTYIDEEKEITILDLEVGKMYERIDIGKAPFLYRINECSGILETNLTSEWTKSCLILNEIEKVKKYRFKEVE